METKSEHFEDIKILNSSLPTLDEQMKSNLRDYIKDVYAKSERARKNCNGIDILSKIQEVEQADRLEHKAFIANLEKWRSKVYLGWIKQAHIATSAYLISNILSGQFFSLTGRTREDRENAEKMTKVIKYLFDTNFNFKKVLCQSIVQMVKKGNTVVKGFWQVIKTYLHDYEEKFEERVNPLTGNVERISIGFEQIKKGVKTYNDVQIEYIDFNDFQFYPVTGDFNLATKIHRKQITYEELLQQKDRYINLEELENYRQTHRDNDTKSDKIELKETWITNAYINGIQLSNAIVTLANDEYIIEYRAMPIDYGLSPFLFAPFDSIEGTNLGRGLCFDALPLQYFANFLVNILMDAQKIGTFSATVIPDDEDVNKFVSRPNAIIQYSKHLFEKGLLPQQFRQDLSNLPFTFDSLQIVKNEFEAMTVPEFIKGVRPNRDETATRDTLVAQGGETRLSLAAENFNELLLKSLIQLIYALYRQRALLDPEIKLKIARIALPCTKTIQIRKLNELGNDILDENNNPTFEEIEVEKTEEELLAELSDIIPMDKVNVTVDGYKTNVSKQKTFQNTKELLQLLPMATEDVQAKINQLGILENILLSLDLNSDTFIFDEDGKKENIIKQIQEAATLEIFKMQENAKVQEAAKTIQTEQQAKELQIIQEKALQNGVSPEMLMLFMQQNQAESPVGQQNK